MPKKAKKFSVQFTIAKKKKTAKILFFLCVCFFFLIVESLFIFTTIIITSSLLYSTKRYTYKRTYICMPPPLIVMNITCSFKNFIWNTNNKKHTKKNFRFLFLSVCRSIDIFNKKKFLNEGCVINFSAS